MSGGNLRASATDIAAHNLSDLPQQDSPLVIVEGRDSCNLVLVKTPIYHRVDVTSGLVRRETVDAPELSESHRYIALYVSALG